MQRSIRPVALAAATVIFGTLGGCGGSGASAPADASAAPSAAPAAEQNHYAELAKLPDWSGVWEPMRLARPSADAKPPEPPKLTPAYAKQYAAFQEKNRTTPGINFISEVANCVPPGVPGSMQQPYPIEFLFTPGRVTILIETYSLVRRVYTDGSAPPEHHRHDREDHEQHHHPGQPEGGVQGRVGH